MKKKFFTQILIFVAVLGADSLYAQYWTPFLPLLEQWSTEELETMSTETQSLQNVFDFKNINLRDVSDDLQNILTDPNAEDPTQGLREMPEVWQDGRNTLEDILERGRAEDRISDTLNIEEALMQFDNIHDIWNRFYEDLDGVLENPLSSNPDHVEEGLSIFEESSGLWEEGFNDPLKGTTMDVHERFALGDKHGNNMKNILDSLFNASYDLEIAFGTIRGDRRFYVTDFPVNANVVRIASVPKFNTTWETRWSLQASYFKGSGETVNLENVDPNDETKALMYNAECAFMYNPKINGGGDVALRLYSSLGMELRTYVPAHTQAVTPRTLNNKGNTTGMGPQIGAGVIVSAGPLTFYTYGTMSSGDVFKAPTGYHYNSTTANAGARLGNSVNVLFSRGFATWSTGSLTDRYITYNQITVGLILADLIR